MSDTKTAIIGVSNIILAPNEKVLLGKRIDNGMLGSPGGHLEPYETIEDATIRETIEETSMENDIDGCMINRIDENTVRVNARFHITRPTLIGCLYNTIRSPVSMSFVSTSLATLCIKNPIENTLEMVDWDWYDINQLDTLNIFYPTRQTLLQIFSHKVDNGWYFKSIE